MLRVLKEKCCRSNEIRGRGRREGNRMDWYGLCDTYIRFQESS